jgi:hypothetical protein
MQTPNPRTIFWGVVLCACPTLLPAQDARPQPAAAPNNTPYRGYGGCPPHSQAGVAVCYPFIYPSVTFIDSPFQLIAAGTGGDGPVGNMQLWVDGRKIGQTSGNIFDKPVTLPSGTHRLTVIEVDTTGHYVKSTPITFEIQGSTAAEPCAPPGSPGVNVCFPSNCHTSPFTTIVAAGTGASGTVSRMELWKDGVKLANFPGAFINTSLYLPDFSKLTIIEVDSRGAYVKSPVITDQSC